jgi:hypothetical protein
MWRDVFPVAGMQGYVNLKGYGEFDAQRVRPERAVDVLDLAHGASGRQE